ncbi:MAG: bacillithiol biosynthesis deacetylase BshB1 [Bacteroidota bacterium]|jgi:bacillithiol biosynthesis deacetylase BshB1
MGLDILAIGAHPDDVELSCSGTLATSVKLGYKVGILDLTEGELGTRGSKAIRLKEANAAAKILGCVRENLHLPDGGIETSRKNILKLVTVLRKYRPQILLIPHSSERHPDHVRAHHLCCEAWYYSGLQKIETKLGGKKQAPWRPKKYFHFMQWHTFTPAFIVDISNSYQTRVESILAYKSQFYDPASREPRTVLSEKSFLDMLDTRAKYYGQLIGVQYGEPFYSVEAIGVGNIFHLKFFKE